MDDPEQEPAAGLNASGAGGCAGAGAAAAAHTKAGTHAVAAAGIAPFRVSRAGRVQLLLALETRADKRVWHPVGGRVEARDGGDAASTAAREWSEETGAVLDAAWLRSAKTTEVWLPRGRVRYFCVEEGALATRLGSPQQGRGSLLSALPRAPPELHGFGWFNVSRGGHLEPAPHSDGGVSDGAPVSPLAGALGAAVAGMRLRQRQRPVVVVPNAARRTQYKEIPCAHGTASV